MSKQQTNPSFKQKGQTIAANSNQGFSRSNLGHFRYLLVEKKIHFSWLLRMGGLVAQICEKMQ